MSVGLDRGRIMELVWSDELVEDLREWIVGRAQLPQATAADFTPFGMSRALTARRVAVADAIRQLGALLEHHAVKPIDPLFLKQAQSPI